MPGLDGVSKGMVLNYRSKGPLGTCAYVLLLSHFTRVLESRKNEARRVVCQVELQISLVECKVVGLIPERTVFAFHVFKLAID